MLEAELLLAPTCAALSLRWGVLIASCSWLDVLNYQRKAAHSSAIEQRGVLDLCVDSYPYFGPLAFPFKHFVKLLFSF